MLLFFAISVHAQDRRVLNGHIPRAITNLNLQSIGRLPASNRLNIAIGLPLRNQAALGDLLRQLYDPASPNYRRYLTPEEFTARFGPTEQDYQAVISFARSNGLTVTATHPNRVVLDVSGSVSDVERAFRLTMRVYQHPSEARDFFAPDVEPSVDLTTPILSVSGLDDFSPPRPNFRIRPNTTTANATPNAGSGPSGSYRGYDFRAAYVPGTSLTGSNQNVALVQFDGYYANDIATYISQAGLATSVVLTNVLLGTFNGSPGANNAEVALDIEMAISMAPGLTKVIVYEAANPSPWSTMLSRIASDNLAKQVSCSWGGGGPDATSELIFQQMAAQGQSFFNASGDSDAFTGSISFPAESTNITQVGGTTLTTTGPVGSWVSETTWNWGNGVGSSGGTSVTYALPSWQQGISMSANQGSTAKRNIPDVALTADNIYVVYNNGSSNIFGGTSCAAPLWAGFTALANEQGAAHGQAPVGFLNPAVYAIGTGAGYTSSFHDITTGNNFSSASPTKYSAVTGYDLCTGWGTPNGQNLIDALTGLLPVMIVNDGATVVTEGCIATNGAIDPGETVTVNFALRNDGVSNTVNMVATLLPTNGVAAPSGPQSYGVLVGGGAPVARPFTFTANGTCGGTITNTLQLQDGTKNLGTVNFIFTLGNVVAAANTFSNAATITIPTGGNATPYPSTINVSGMPGLIDTVTVTITNLTHTNPDDIDILLVGPGGQSVILMSDAGGTPDVNNVTLTFSGAATSSLPNSTQIVSGTYLPSNYGAGTDSFGSPAPAGPYGSALSVFSGQVPNGTWSLYVVDDSSFSSSGSIGRGWRLTISSSSISCCTTPTANLALGKSASPSPATAGSSLTYTIAVTNNGPSTATSVTVTDALPASVTFNTATPSQGTCTNIGGVVTCNLGSLASNAVATVSIGVVPTVTGTLTNTATTASDVPDLNPANNAATAITTVLSPAIQVVAPASRVYGTVITGQSSNQTFSVINNGQATLLGTATLVTAGSPFAIAGGSPYNVLGGQTGAVNVSFSPSSAGSFNNTVAFKSNGGVSSNAVSGSAVTPAHLSVSPASYGFATSATGTTAQTTFVVTNTGGAALSGTATITATGFGIASGGSYAVAGFGSSNVVVRFTPPTANSFTGNVVFVSTGGNSTNGVTGTGAIVPLASFSANVTTGAAPLTVTFTDSSTGTITNRFWSFGDTTTSNTTATSVQHTYNAGTNTVMLIVGGPLGVSTNTRPNYIVVTNLVPQADLLLTKTGSPNPVLTSQSLTYTLTIANLGPSAASSVVLTDAVPASVSVVSAVATVGTCTNVGGLVTCSLGVLASNSVATVTIVGTPSAASNIAVITNTASVGASVLDPLLANNTASALTTVYRDTFGDGVPDWWRELYFIDGGSTNGSSCAGCDPDGDGFSNVQEYLAGTDPTDPNSALKITGITASAADFLVEFTTVSGKKYELDWTDDLVTGTWGVVATDIPGTGGIVQITDPGATAQSQRFYRVQLLVP